MKTFFVILGCALALGVGITAQKNGRGRGFAQPEGVREVTVTAIPGVVAQGAHWTLAWQGTDNADGIIASSDGGLLFAQEQPNRISKLDRNDKVAAFLENTHGTGALSIDAKGRLSRGRANLHRPRPERSSLHRSNRGSGAGSGKQDYWLTILKVRAWGV